MLEIIPYTESRAQQWDHFVLHKSMNGTFLQTRNFLNYHPPGRFQDASLLVMQGDCIAAVIPAAERQDDNGRCFYAHPGSTFGGIVLGNACYNMGVIEEIFDLLEDRLKQAGYSQAVFRQTPDIFAARRCDLLEYVFYRHGYAEWKELSFYIDCRSLPEDIVSAWTASRRRDYRYACKNALSFRFFDDAANIEYFHSMLQKNLERHHVAPVHTAQEMMMLNAERLQHQMDFCGVFLEDTLVAGSMLFYFDKRVLHTQYLAQDYQYSHLFVMNFLIYNLIRLAREQGFETFSFGISTEDHGHSLNTSLSQFKEGFGSRHSINRTYYKQIQ